MMNGEQYWRRHMPDLDEDQYQPAGIDLTLGKLEKSKNGHLKPCGLFKNHKELPALQEVEPLTVQLMGEWKDVFYLEPHGVYIGTTNEYMEIDEASAQLYLPRSSLLRAGVDVRTALGDPGFHGYLSFMIINHNDFSFMLEKDVRFAQAVDIGVLGIMSQYDGDYNEPAD